LPKKGKGAQTIAPIGAILERIVLDILKISLSLEEKEL